MITPQLVFQSMSSAGKLVFLDEVESVSKEAERLKKDGVDIIIGLSHAGIVTDRIVAASVKDIDVIVGGHSHTLLYSGKYRTIYTLGNKA